jgi:hypothetical protein
MDPWWTAQASGLIGGLGGAMAGLVGGLLGAAIGMLAPRGIGRRWVVGMQLALVGVGAVSLVAGAVAVVSGQPYHVYYPLLLLGLILTLVMGCLIPVVRRTYAQAEARRLEAEELRRA